MSIALALVSGIVLVPLYLQYIPLDLYGAWLATGNILVWLTVIDPGLSTVLQQRAGAAYGKGDVGELGALLTGGVVLSGTIGLLVLLIGLISFCFLAHWLNLSTSIDIATVEKAFVLATLGSALMIFSYGLTAFNQGLQSSLGIGIVFVATLIGSLTLTVILLCKGAGLLALPIGLITRGVGLTIGNAAYLYWRIRGEKLRFPISFRGVAALARLSSYTFLGRGANVIANHMDAFILTRYLGPEIAPIFVLTRKAPDMSRMFLERPAVAFMPAVSSLVGAGETGKAKIVLLRLMRMIIWLIGLIAGGFFLFNSAFVSLWVGPELFAGGIINLFVVLVLVVTVVVNALSNLCFSMGNIKGNSIASLAQGLIAVPLMILGARYWGMLGVAVSPLIAMVVVSVWYYPYAFSQIVKMTKEEIFMIFREGTKVVCATAVTVVAFFWVKPEGWLTFSISVIAFSTLYILLLLALSNFLRSEVLPILKKIIHS